MFHFLLDIPIRAGRTIADAFQWTFMSVSTKRGDSADDQAAGTSFGFLLKRILFLPLILIVWGFRLCLAVLVAPFHAFSFERERWIRVLLGLPAAFGFLTTIGVAIYLAVNHQAVTHRYISSMQSAMVQGDFKLASTIGGRLMTEASERTPDVTFQYAIALGKSGELTKSLAIINSLAPDDVIGFAPAHQWRAVRFSQSFGDAPTDEQLEILRWHLTNSGPVDNEEIHYLWCAYYQRVGQTANAIAKLEMAARLNPARYMTLSDLYRSIGKTNEANKALEQARDYYKRRLENTPLDSKTRLVLALTLARLGQYDETERVLQTGLQIAKTPELLRALADFYLMKFDLAVSDKKTQGEGLELLDRAIRIDPDYEAIYVRLLSLFEAKKEGAERETIVKLLEQMIVDGKNAGTAHFALSCIASTLGKADESMMHLQQSFAISPNMPQVCNRLAWMLAHADEPDLDRAQQLAEQAVKAIPNAINFHGTLGTVLLKKQQYEDAIRELEFGLAQRNVAVKETHASLAQAYEAIGNSEIARLHAAKAK